MHKPTTYDFSELIPELSQWNDGKGIDPEVWIGNLGNYELAIGYSLIFWPKFIRFDGYVLRDGFSLESLRAFEKNASDRSSVEATMNHIHLSDIHYGATANEGQVRYLGRVLKDIHELKLRHEFPDTQFIVAFNDEDGGPDQVDYQLTFWQSVD